MNIGSTKQLFRKLPSLGLVALAMVFAAPTAADDDDDDEGIRTKTVNCPGGSVQGAVDKVKGPATIFIEGTCVEDVVITKDDITLSGNEAGAACNRASPGGTGTINGTITVDGVRARIEFLTITGSGGGVDIVNRADVRLVCDDISNNEATGVSVVRSSNAVIKDSTLSGNGTRTTNPFIFFDCGLFAADASSVRSSGSTYENNQYCAIEVDRQASFRSGDFLPRAPDNPADPNERDVFTELGCDPATGSGCFTDDEGPVVIETFSGGLVDIRNADINGEIGATALSTFRVDGDVAIQGNIRNQFGSLVRIADRFARFGDRGVSFTGQLRCFDTSQTFFSAVRCTQICNGFPSLGACRFPQCDDGIDNDLDSFVDLDDPQCFGDPNNDNES